MNFTEEDFRWIKIRHHKNKEEFFHDLGKMFLMKMMPIARHSDPDSLYGKLAIYEKKILEDSLSANKWNKSATARELKISRATLLNKIKYYGIR